jgi:hypothetical protein
MRDWMEVPILSDEKDRSYLATPTTEVAKSYRRVKMLYNYIQS